MSALARNIAAPMSLAALSLITDGIFTRFSLNSSMAFGNVVTVLSTF
jgi:hypothetical protein